MSSPHEPSVPPVDPAVEPGHRARALAASLLNELTGQRRGAQPLPSTPRPTDTAASPAAEGEADDPLRAPAPGPADVPTLAPGPLPALDEPAAGRLRPVAGAGGPDGAAPGETAAGGTSTGDGPGATSGPPASDIGSGVEGEADAGTAVHAAVAPSTAGGTALGSSSASTSLRPQAPRPVAVRTAGEQDVRPAPFTYAAVAEHHTGPARATANDALDQAGQRISSRVDRAQARRAASVTVEAASLLDACDVLDARAQAVDRTWTGERHSATEVREFDGSWSAFYDAQSALAQHVAD